MTSEPSTAVSIRIARIARIETQTKRLTSQTVYDSRNGIFPFLHSELPHFRIRTTDHYHTCTFQVNRSENPASRLRSDADNGGRRSAGNDSARRIVSCTRMSITRYSALAPTSCSGKAPEKIITPPNADDDGVAKVAAVSSDNGGVDSNVEYRTNLMALRRRMKVISHIRIELNSDKIKKKFFSSHSTSRTINYNC